MSHGNARDLSPSQDLNKRTLNGALWALGLLFMTSGYHDGNDRSSGAPHDCTPGTNLILARPSGLLPPRVEHVDRSVHGTRGGVSGQPPFSFGDTDELTLF